MDFLKRNDAKTYLEAKDYLKKINIKSKKEYDKYVNGKTLEYKK